MPHTRAGIRTSSAARCACRRRRPPFPGARAMRTATTATRARRTTVRTAPVSTAASASPPTGRASVVRGRRRCASTRPRRRCRRRRAIRTRTATTTTGAASIDAWTAHASTSACASIRSGRRPAAPDRPPCARIRPPRRSRASRSSRVDARRRATVASRAARGGCRRVRSVTKARAWEPPNSGACAVTARSTVSTGSGSDTMRTMPTRLTIMFSVSPASRRMRDTSVRTGADTSSASSRRVVIVPVREDPGGAGGDAARVFRETLGACYAGEAPGRARP